MSSDSARPNSKYVESQNGFRVFFFALVIACIAGLSLRLYLNPNRIKGWLDHAFGEQGAQIGLRFQSASLKLARGSIPQLAIEITDIEANPAKDCRSEPSIQIAKLRLPVNFAALFHGRVSIGTVSAEDMRVDLDGLKARCPSHSQNSFEPSRRASKDLFRLPAAASSSPNAAGPTLTVEPWWNVEHLGTFQKLVEGFEFSRVEIAFEDRTKKVYLDSFLLVPGKDSGTVHLETDLVIPPELTYGERLPPLRLDIDARATEAAVNVKAAVSEGSLQAKVILKPAPGGLLDTRLRASIVSVPLSTLVPLVTKSGIVKGAFRPRFMWMSCQASIEGRFQGLFSNNRLLLEACEIEGNGARIRADSAIRNPDGSWDPFHIGMTNVDLGQILEVFDWQGPDGVFSDYGRLDGKLTIISKDDARFTGAIKGAQIRFSNRSVRADQRITQMNARAELNNGRLVGALDQLAIEGGEFEGGLEVSLKEHATEGTVTASIKHMRLAEAVQKVLVGGRLESINGRAIASLEKGKLKALTGNLKISDLAGRDLRLREASITTELTGPGGEFMLILRSPEIEIHQSSVLFHTTKPLFFEHSFHSEWVPVSDPIIRARIGKGGAMAWEKVDGTLESGRIHISSNGSMNREHELDGWVAVDYPNARKLKWKVSGRLEAPMLSDDTKLISDLRARGADDRALGLQSSSAAADSDSGDSVALKTKEGLRALQEKVIRGAKNIMPARHLEQSAEKTDQTD